MESPAIQGRFTDVPATNPQTPAKIRTIESGPCADAAIADFGSLA